MNRRAFCTLPLAVATANTAGTVEALGLTWSAPYADDWRVSNDGGVETLHLTVARPKADSPRKPIQYALAQTGPLARFTLECEVQRIQPKGSLIIVYAWKDASHFNYVHLSDDTGTKQPVHNGIFHVYGGDRVRISSEDGPCSLPTGEWHRVKVSYDAKSHLVETWVDGQPIPALRGADFSLGAGLIGLGSFFNTGSFRKLKLTR